LLCGLKKNDRDSGSYDQHDKEEAE
jgi:hypothetical protein